jgi:hypothetical protein
MPTAIIRIYTASGFVVAADGRTVNSATGEVTNDQLQKIYQMGNAPSVASFTGGAKLGKVGSDSNEILFDFILELTKAFQVVSSRQHSTLQGYATKIANLVQKKLETAMLGGNIELPSIRKTKLVHVTNPPCKWYKRCKFLQCLHAKSITCNACNAASTTNPT